MNKYNVHQIAKTLDKIFTAGFTNEKKDIKYSTRRFTKYS